MANLFTRNADGVAIEIEACNCEHIDHFDNEPYSNPTPRTAHIYLSVPASDYTMSFVGHICEDCYMHHSFGIKEDNSVDFDREENNVND